MIQYRKSDGTLGQCDADKVTSINVNGNTFTINLRYYGWDEYDFWNEEITDVIEIRIG